MFQLRAWHVAKIKTAGMMVFHPENMGPGKPDGDWGHGQVLSCDQAL